MTAFQAREAEFEDFSQFIHVQEEKCRRISQFKSDIFQDDCNFRLFSSRLIKISVFNYYLCSNYCLAGFFEAQILSNQLLSSNYYLLIKFQPGRYAGSYFQFQAIFSLKSADQRQI